MHGFNTWQRHYLCSEFLGSSMASIIKLRSRTILSCKSSLASVRHYFSIRQRCKMQWSASFISLRKPLLNKKFCDHSIYFKIWHFQFFCWNVKRLWVPFVANVLSRCEPWWISDVMKSDKKTDSVAKWSALLLPDPAAPSLVPGIHKNFSS